MKDKKFVAEDYLFSDFTLNNYKRLLELALTKNFNFRFFEDSFAKSDKIIFLRHDLEFSVDKALEMAKIENDLGILTTYFVQIHSDFYNPFDKKTFDSITNIMSLGHQIGLHFDTHFWNITEERHLEEYLLLDKLTLQNYYNIEINTFSFHRTNKFILSCKKDQYANLLNVYSNKIMSNIDYCTDSLGYWRYDRLEDKLNDTNTIKLQALIHDGMWQDEILPPRKRIHKVIEQKEQYLKKYYDSILESTNAKNIDWEGAI